MRKLTSLATVTLFLVLVCPSLVMAQEGKQTFLLVVDDLHLEFRSTPVLRELVRKVVKALVRDGDSVAAVSTGPSSVAVLPTSNLQRVTSGLESITGESLEPNQILEPQHADERLRRARSAVATVREAIRVVASRATGPIVVLYFSSGYADQAVSTDLAELASDAYRATAVIYAFEPRGLVGGAAPTPNTGSESAWGAYYRDTRDSLRSLAESTGGLMISTRSEFMDALPYLARTANE